MFMLERLINRREALAGLSAASIGLATTVTSAAAKQSVVRTPKSGAVDLMARLRDPREAFQTMIRMMASSAAEDCTWFYRGTMYAQVGDSAPTPIVGLIGAETYWPVRQPNGDVVLSASTFSYPTPLFSEEPLARFENPFTNESNTPTPNVYRNDHATLITPEGMIHAPGGAVDPHSLQFTRIGDTLQMQHDVGQRQMPQPQRELAVLSAPIAEILDERVRRVTASSADAFIARWPKWMNMGSRPGHVIWFIGSQKVRSPEEMPEPYLSRLRREHPTLISARPGTAGTTDVAY